MNPTGIETREVKIIDGTKENYDYIEQMGKAIAQSRLFGEISFFVGMIIYRHCQWLGISEIDFRREYHVIPTQKAVQITMRSDTMLAKYMHAGGQCTWENLGDDGIEAKATFSFIPENNQKPIPISYSMDDATAAGISKLNESYSNYKKNPGSMLRARLVSKALRIVAPSIVQGVYVPEEMPEPQQPEPAQGLPDGQIIQAAEIFSKIGQPINEYVAQRNAENKKLSSAFQYMDTHLIETLQPQKELQQPTPQQQQQPTPQPEKATPGQMQALQKLAAAGEVTQAQIDYFKDEYDVTTLADLTPMQIDVVLRQINADSENLATDDSLNQWVNSVANSGTTDNETPF